MHPIHDLGHPTDKDLFSAWSGENYKEFKSDQNPECLIAATDRQVLGKKRTDSNGMSG